MIRAVLIAYLLGLMTSGAWAVWVGYPLLSSMGAQMANIEANFDMGSDMVIDGHKHADALAMARQKAALAKPDKQLMVKAKHKGR